MTQEAVVEESPSPADDVSLDSRALAVCESCGHMVPKTMMCLYCGAPILFKKPREDEG